MDKFLYISMSGAKENMNALAIHSNNLANANKTGFKASFEQARSMQVYGQGQPTRVFALTEEPGQNFESGIMQTTGRDLDISIQGDGWFVVESELGGEGMSRSGGLNINNDGMLVDSNGSQVLDIQGIPIYIQLPVEKFNIRQDGMVEVRPEGAPAEAMEEIAQIKLVNPDVKGLMRGEDGLFRQIDGQDPEWDRTVRVQSGTLEASNVNLSSELTSLINLQRHFEMQIKMMKNAEEIDKSSETLLRVV
ncbi:flagellar biosynthesis protein FlgF [Psychromonas sp. psych-6C06]|uniref:flagellar basal body rod protein FlgF n=1 Tax=Psychromonas sp. psych-6C06 TaxID=2058089 RepID=UPI000C3422AF|nr:flagellar basal body rod protein FlgF [Psychromonas sp. psych-6C06]PKF62766.1 flagellar biosynthesis protein FlgF [Psychromonas sp. psych-6C06]